MLLSVMVAGGCASNAFAVTSSSSNYQVTETEFGSMSNTESCSGQYCARASIGDMSGGKSKSSGGEGSTAQFGTIAAESEPLLEVIVDPGESNLGVLSAEQTSYKTTTVKIRNYQSGGYMLQIVGNPPKYGSHTLNAPSTPTSSQPGTEQFGINAAANTIPTVGAAPVQVPSAQTSFGAATDDYKTPNMFKYTSGDVVAQSDTESGRTDYTISMIVNVSNKTPAGHYTGEFSAVVIPVY